MKRQLPKSELFGARIERPMTASRQRHAACSTIAAAESRRRAARGPTVGPRGALEPPEARQQAAEARCTPSFARRARLIAAASGLKS